MNLTYYARSQAKLVTPRKTLLTYCASSRIVMCVLYAVRVKGIAFSRRSAYLLELYRIQPITARYCSPLLWVLRSLLLNSSTETLCFIPTTSCPSSNSDTSVARTLGPEGRDLNTRPFQRDILHFQNARR